VGQMPVGHLAGIEEFSLCFILQYDLLDGDAWICPPINRDSELQQLRMTQLPFGGFVWLSCF
jgi:hypothetical protein